jgi:hypothetical protein
VYREKYSGQASACLLISGIRDARNSTEVTSVMNMCTIALGCLLLFAGLLYARERTDLIVMKNGDHLTGEIKGSQRRCALRQHGIQTRNKLGSMVGGGSPGKQAVVSREDGERCSLHRGAQHLKCSVWPTHDN